MYSTAQVQGNVKWLEGCLLDMLNVTLYPSWSIQHCGSCVSSIPNPKAIPKTYTIQTFTDYFWWLKIGMV